MLMISRLSMARAACTSSGRACAFDFSPPDRLKALSHDFTSIHAALHSRIIHASFYENPVAIDDKRLEPRKLRAHTRLPPFALPPPSAQGLHEPLILSRIQLLESLSQPLQPLLHPQRQTQMFESLPVRERYDLQNRACVETNENLHFMVFDRSLGGGFDGFVFPPWTTTMNPFRCQKNAHDMFST